ncbi:hypothetical protein LSCM1_05862 [Leishmania martiniquensis]|uniref:TATA element modulatory factor 1 TATA binding domain-containing protein n=1 Tax=Leishmania martiniquensis TaxID=1580590 RepID=A0A836KV74_9TRYP|nr:hypothetical protein LSCM1_05862 [Leishmania martiniquensis]
MWTNFLDKIQQRIGDAVDLLGDEEVEGVEGEDEAGALVVIPALKLKDSVLPQQRMREQPASSSENPDTGAGAETVEDYELSESVTPSYPQQPRSRGSTPAAQVLPVPPTPLSSLPTPGLPVATLPPEPATVSGPTDVIPSPTASPPLMPTSTESGQRNSCTSPRDTAPSVAGSLLRSQDGEVPMPPKGRAAPPPVNTLPVKATSQEDTEAHHSTLPCTEPTPAVTSVPASVFSASEHLPSRPLPPSLSFPVAAEPSPSPPLEMARECSDVGQLLRFQQQLAEEMESVTKLQRQNASLKERVSALEEQLANSTASLSRTADSERQVSLLIERLGKEKERHKAVAEERSQLKERVQDLEEELEEYRVREEGWISGQEQQQENEIAARQRIAQLEDDARSCNAAVDDLRTQLREAKHLNVVLQNQVEELKVSYSAQLDTVKVSSSDTVDQLRQEVEQLRSSLQNLSTEYDTRTTELELEVRNANMRAHQAEARLSEMEFGSVNTLRDLRSELEDSQRSSATWKAEAQKARNEYTELLDQYASLKRSRAAAEADLRDRLSSESNTVAALRKGIREWEDRYLALQESLGATQGEIKEQRTTIMQLESTIQKLKVASGDMPSRSQSDVLMSSDAPPMKTSLSEPLLSRSPLTQQLGGRPMPALPLNPFMNMERPAWSDSTDRKTRERLEQEVVRQSAELERVRAVAADGAVWKGKYNRLQEEHDLLLQLYGQLEEDVSALRKNGACTSSLGAAVGSSASGSVSATAAP